MEHHIVRVELVSGKHHDVDATATYEKEFDGQGMAPPSTAEAALVYIDQCLANGEGVERDHGAGLVVFTIQAIATLTHYTKSGA